MYSIIDIESNGAGFREECIIEIAVFIYDGHRTVEQFITLVNPESSISPYVQKLTGITPKMVKTAPKFHEIAKRIIEITEGTTLVGHNIEFDYRMLRQSFRRLGYEFRCDTIDTIPLAKKLIPNAESYSLGKLCKSIGIPLVDAHRAAGDARATLELFKLLISKDTNNEIIQAHHEKAHTDTYSNKVGRLTENLPTEQGIIYFQSKEGKILYAAYADNIYKKAKNILNSKSPKEIKIQHKTEQISYEFTGTNIIALLMMKEKGLKQNLQLPFCIVYNKQKKIFLISTKKKEEEIRLFKFKSYSQAEKFLSLLKKRTEKLEYAPLKKETSLSGRNEIWVSRGRTRSEKSFLALRGGKLVGYGFYELYHQVLSWDKIQKLMIPVASLSENIRNEMKIALLKGEFKIIPINTSSLPPKE